MEIRSLDLGDRAVLAEAYSVECDATKHCRPDWVPLGREARVAAWLADNGWRRTLIGAFDDGRMVGLATTQTAYDTPDTTWLSVSVLPARQRRGVGTALTVEAERTSPAGASRFVASAYRPTPEGMESLVRGFAHPLGYACATTETVVELDLHAVRLGPVAPVDGYAVVTYVDGVPPDLRAQVGALKGMVDAEAPNGELHWEPTPVSAEEYAAELALWREQGRTAVESLALDRHGVVAAWTCLVTPAELDRPAQVEGTLVLREHRGQGLGAAVKVASLVTARERGRTTRVRTSSDDGNVWMRAINAELGFVPVESEVLLHKQRECSST